MGTEACTCCDDNQMLYVNVKSLNSIPQTNTTLYVKQKFEKKKKIVTYKIQNKIDDNK